MSAPPLADRITRLTAAAEGSGDPVVAGLVAVVAEQATELAALREEIVELRRQLGRHSGNSGQPPSQDGPAAPPRPRRRSRGRRAGGQPGHAGTTRRPVAPAQVDVGLEHWPARCRHCDAALPRADAGPVARRQVHDLPVPPPLVVTEHRAHAVRCPQCRARTRAPFPAAVSGPVQWGPRLQALVAYLRYAQHLPVARLARLLWELHGVALATGTVANLCRRVAERLTGESERLRERALAMPVACMDETGLRVAGETAWLHVLCDETLTCYRLGGRGDIWTEHVGVAVHDRFGAYASRLPQETVHALCNAHLLRNLQEIVELEQAPEGWAARLQQLLREARATAAHWYDTTGGPVPVPDRERMAAAWDTLLQPVLDHYESLPPPARGRRRGHNLALALWTHRDACLHFLADPRVPFTNNRAEQALRMVKLQMKISGSFRTWAGAQRFAHVRGLLETARKQDRDLLAVLQPDPVLT